MSELGRRHRNRVKDSYSYLERVNLQWLLWLSVSAGAIWGMATLFQLLESTGTLDFARADGVTAVALAILVYGIGYLGLKQPEISSTRRLIRRFLLRRLQPLQMFHRCFHNGRSHGGAAAL